MMMDDAEDERKFLGSNKMIRHFLSSYSYGVSCVLLFYLRVFCITSRILYYTNRVEH